MALSNTTIFTLSEQLAAFEATSEARENTAWLLLNGITILGMQFGFALLEAGCTSVRFIVSARAPDIQQASIVCVMYSPLRQPPS
jgi:hypothetical protein